MTAISCPSSELKERVASTGCRRIKGSIERSAVRDSRCEHESRERVRNFCLGPGFDRSPGRSAPVKPRNRPSSLGVEEFMRISFLWGLAAPVAVCLVACEVQEAPVPAAPTSSYGAGLCAGDASCDPVPDCDEDPSSCPPPPPPTYPTYEKDVRVILDERCGDCHAPGGVAEFLDLTDYDTVWGQRSYWCSVLDAPQSNNDTYMPPWAADSSCRDYDGDRSLEPAWIAQLQGWESYYNGCNTDSCKAQARGDSSHAPASAPYEVTTQFAFDDSAPSVQATPNPPTQVTFSSSVDRYVCRAFPYSEWSDSNLYPNGVYITGMKVLPDQVAAVHHVLNYTVSPANLSDFATAQGIGTAELDQGQPFDCYSMDFGTTDLVGGWVPGGEGGRFPSGTGIHVPAGSHLIMQMHYNSTSSPVTDATSVRFSVTDSVTQVGRLMAFTKPGWTLPGGMPISPGATTHSHSAPVGLLNGGRGLYLWATTFHMHDLGSGGKVWLEHSSRNGGGETCLVDIPDHRWRFDWQQTYWFDGPAQYARPTDRLSIECRWDNETGQAVEWGEGSEDEMCVAYLFVTDGLP